MPSSLNWTTTPTWMRVSVIFILELCSHLDQTPLITYLVHFSSMDLSPSQSHLDLCSHLDASPCHLYPGPLLLPGWEPLSSLTWTTAPAWVEVLSLLCSHLDASHCHLSTGLLPLSGWESLSSLTWTSAPDWMRGPFISHLDHFSHLNFSPDISQLDHCSSLHASSCHLSPGSLLLPECETFSYLSWTTASVWIEFYVISYLVHCSGLDACPCYLSHGPLLPPRCESLSSLT